MTGERMVKLSICIPTLNHGSYIGATLESIVSQLGNDVELVLVDGGSGDETADVIRAFQERSPQVHCWKTAQETSSAPAPSAEGFDRDCDRAVEVASGEYCWLMSDDDILKPAAIRRVLEEVSRGYELVIVNAEVRNADLSELIESRRMKTTADRTYTPEQSDEFLGDVGHYLSYVGGVVIRRDLWRRRERRGYYGIGFLHACVILQRALTGPVRVIAEPLIAIRFGTAHWTGRWFSFYMVKWPDLIWSFPAFSDEAKRRVWSRSLATFLLRLMAARARGYYSLDTFQTALAARQLPRYHRPLARAIAAVPGRPLNALGLVFHALTVGEPSIHLTELRWSPFYVGARFEAIVRRCLGRLIGSLRRTAASG
jgi:abequosyltransferase